MTEEFKVVIPARYDSVHFPGKPLAKINGKPLIQYVYDNAVDSGASEVVIATDGTLVGMCAEEFGATVCMTNGEHASGTDRVAEVIEKFNWDDQTVVVNLHGDEPLTSSLLINQVATSLIDNPEADCATLHTPITSEEEVDDPEIVKVVTDSAGFAMYFSRSAIPARRDTDNDTTGPTYYRHIGLYAYRAGLLRIYKNLPVSDLEKSEQLEQLRLLWNGMRIHTAEASEVLGLAVTSQDDIEKIEAMISSGSIEE